MNKFQIVVVGSTGVGKRSLKRQFAILNSDAKKQADKPLKNSQKLDDVPCALNIAIVDSKDQGNKAGLIQKGHAFVIVYSVEDKSSFDGVASWRDDIIALKNEMVLSLSGLDGDNVPPIVICANKSDIDDGRVISKSEGEGLSFQLKSAFYEISCSTTKNINVVYQHLVTELQSYRRRRVKQRNGYSDKKSLKKTKKKKGAPKGKITLEGHTFDLDKPSVELVEHLMRRLETKENGTSHKNNKSVQVNKRLSQLSEENSRSKRLIAEHKGRVEDLEKNLEHVKSSLKEEEQKTADLRRKLAKTKRKKLKERDEKAEMEVKLKRMREDVKKWKAQCGEQKGQIDYLETELHNSERSRSRGRSIDSVPYPTQVEYDTDSDGEGYSPPERTLSASVLNYKIDLSDILTSNELGKGSYGIVRNGFWRGCRIAVKQLLSSATQMQQEAFYQEAERLSLLRPHPHVVQFLGATNDSDSLCIVTELIEAGTLLQRLQDISWTISQAVVKKIVLGIAAGMLHLHKEGIIHRDLATRNILMSADGHVKISDFGYARQVLEHEDQNTTEQNLGPFRWMAPESMVGSQGKFLYSKAGGTIKMIFVLGVLGFIVAIVSYLFWKMCGCSLLYYMRYSIVKYLTPIQVLLKLYLVNVKQEIYYCPSQIYQ
mmetsp:Transcript_481/g.559  ORF Transcript_481/g.559 Transcript_481/m.559 type:complete len:656 (-) Transcript_481:666-2633(-)